MASKELAVRNMAFATGTGGAGAGAAVYIGDLNPATVVLAVGGTFNATVQFQASIDNQTWVSCGPTFVSTAGSLNMTTTGTAPVAGAAWVRVSCTAFVSNTSAVATVGGVPNSL